MLIHAGYEISYGCPQPTPMILTLSVHPSRINDLVNPDRVMFDPPIPANTYHDSFGNFCHVISAPAGGLTMRTEFVIRDSGLPDAVAPDAGKERGELSPPRLRDATPHRHSAKQAPTTASSTRR